MNSPVNVVNPSCEIFRFFFVILFVILFGPFVVIVVDAEVLGSRV